MAQTTLSSVPLLSGQDILTNSSTQNLPLGGYMETSDGRGFRYAKVGAVATVALTAAQCGQTFNNRSTSGSPSWTLPTAANGLWYTFTVSDVTTGFTVTGGTIKAKTSATGTAISGTTLTNTQGTAVIGDNITLVCDGTNWVAVSQSGIFAAA